MFQRCAARYSGVAAGGGDVVAGSLKGLLF
jgi:hypothetical protein